MRSPFDSNNKKMVKCPPPEKKKVKVLFVLKDRNISYGKISFGLVNSAQFVANALNDLNLKDIEVEAKCVRVQDSNSIDREIHLFKPKIVIIEAYFTPPKKMEELIKLHKNVFWTIRIHSQILFFSNEGIFCEWTRGYWELAKKYKNIVLSSNSKKFINALKKSFDINIDYLPNIYKPKDYGFCHTKENYDDILDVGLFCSVRPLKNLVIQALVAITLANYLGKKLRLYINAGRMEQSGAPTLKNLTALFENTPHTLIQLDWYNHDDFSSLIRKMDLVLACSITETFSLVGADASFNDVPMVGCTEMEWMSHFFQADPLDFDDIFNKALKAYKGKYLNLQRFNKEGLIHNNAMAEHEWVEWVRKHSC